MSNKAISGILGVALMAAMLVAMWSFMEPVQGGDTEKEETQRANVTVNVNISCGFDSNFMDGVDFGSVDPGTANVSETVNGYNVTAAPTNNKDINVYIKANDNMQSTGSDYILLGNMTWHDNSTYPPVFTIDNDTMSTTYTKFYEIGSGLSAGGVHHFQIWLDVPNVAAGEYNNTIYVKCNATS